MIYYICKNCGKKIYTDKTVPADNICRDCKNKVKTFGIKIK